MDKFFIVFLRSDVIRIEQKYCGSIRYSNGYFGSVLISDSDAWFVAFKTDRAIDKLMHAKLSYYWEERSQKIDGFTAQTTTSVIKSDTTVVEFDGNATGGNIGNGLFGYKWTWDRIVSISDFIADNSDNLTDDCKSKLNSSAYSGGWVLRFAETEYDSYSVGSVIKSYYKDYTVVENVTILELTFETEGKPYNLGVVDNYQTPDLNPDGEYTTGDGIEQAIDDFIEKMDKWWEQLLFILGIVVAGIAIVLVVSVIWPIIWPAIVAAFKWICKAIATLFVWGFKGLWFLLSLPFVLIGKLFKRKDKYDDEDYET